MRRSPGSARIVVDVARPSRGAVLLVHGFTRGPEHQQVLAERFVAEGLTVIRPRLGALSPRTAMSRASALETVAVQIRMSEVEPGIPWVVVGHSAGAAAGTWLGADLLDCGVAIRGFVYADGVESPSGLIARAWPRISHLPVFDVSAEPSRCNRHGGLVDWLEPRRSGVFGVRVPGSGHADVEGDVDGDVERASRAVYRWACGDRSSRATRDLVRDLIVGQVLATLGLHTLGDSGRLVEEQDWAGRGLVPLVGTQVPSTNDEEENA